MTAVQASLAPSFTKCLAFHILNDNNTYTILLISVLVIPYGSSRSTSVASLVRRVEATKRCSTAAEPAKICQYFRSSNQEPLPNCFQQQWRIHTQALPINSAKSTINDTCQLSTHSLRPIVSAFPEGSSPRQYDQCSEIWSIVKNKRKRPDG